MQCRLALQIQLSKISTEIIQRRNKQSMKLIGTKYDNGVNGKQSDAV